MDTIAEKKYHTEMWQWYSEEMRPPEKMSPSAFAEKERKLHSVYCSEMPGDWHNDVFPYQAPIMDTVEEAITTGKRGVVMMKSGQGGGTDLAINGQLWIKKYYPGPQLFMTSTADTAGEFGRERFDLIIKDMPSLSKKYISNKRGDIMTKRFSDGKIQLAGGQSVYVLQGTPYRAVVLDEVDSLSENLGKEGDPVKMAEIRTDSFRGPTLIIAYAHPTLKERGAAKIFFEQSDQRRGFVTHSCGGEFWLQWEHVKFVGPVGMSEKDPDGYEYICPCCGEIVSDAVRVAMVRNVRYKSTLPPAEAAKKSWIGVHFSQLYYPAKTIRGLAERWIECGDDDNSKRVFYNKVLGEPYDPKVKKINFGLLRDLVVINRRVDDPEFYLRGQVPSWVRFLTAGQDSRTVELHYAVWGWGLRKNKDGYNMQCGCLIDWGCVKRQYNLIFTEAEFHVFDDLIYNKIYTSVDSRERHTVRQCGHDIGYQPTQAPIIKYCRTKYGRAIPVTGASDEATSRCDAPYVRWGQAMKFKAGETEQIDTTSKKLIINTYLLKQQLYGWVESGKYITVNDIAGDKSFGDVKISHISFPHDVSDDFLKQIDSEELIARKDGELVYKKKGPNHYGDCTIYAEALAHNLDWFQGSKTAEEARASLSRKSYSSRPIGRDPSMG